MDWSWSDFGMLVLRWLHILSAIALVGGAFFQRFALIGPAAELPEDARTRLLDAVRRRWSKVVMAAILFLLVSGLANAFTTMPEFRMAFQLNPNHERLKLPRPTYDILLGVKILLALTIFFFASALSGRGKATAGFRQQASKWLSVNLFLAVVLVCISGVMRSFHTGPNVSRVLEVLKSPSQSNAIPYTPNSPASGDSKAAPKTTTTTTGSGEPPPPMNIELPTQDK